MPRKRGSTYIKNKKTVNQKEINKKEEIINDISDHSESDYDDNVEDFQSSEEELRNSEDEYSAQSGGDTDREETENELGDDNTSLDIDPDDEEDPNEDDKYDPINEIEELEDPDEETDIEEEIKEDEEEDVDEGQIMESEEGLEVYESKPCHVKNLNKDFIVLDEDDSNMYGKMEYKKIPDAERESDSVMTYYEMVRIIGTRAQQFNFGAEPLVKGLEGLHPAKMAYLELIAKMTPFIIRRHLPGKKYEEWRIDELDIIHTITDDFFVPEKFDWDALMKQANELNKMKEQIYVEKIPNKSSKTNNSRITGSKRSNARKNSRKKNRSF